MIQPFDVYGFRFWKNFVRKFSDILILLNYYVNLHECNNIIRMQSLTHNQLSSQRLQDVFKYGWYKSGYAVIKLKNFKNPVEFCFNTEQEPICGGTAIIRCTWCKKQLCFKHCFIDFHYRTKYVL